MNNLKTIYLREIRSYFNTPMAYIFLVVFALVNSYFFTLWFFPSNQSDMRSLFSIVPLAFVPHGHILITTMSNSLALCF